MNRFPSRLPLRPLSINSKVDHHDRVLLHDADQQDDPDDPDHPQIIASQHQGQQSPNPSRRQRRQDRQRMHIALVQHPKNDVHTNHRRQNQPQLIRQRLLISPRSPQKSHRHTARQPDLLGSRANRRHRPTE
ncbi:hypothetical protein D3C86_1595240 [compost metagenome]